MSPCLRSYVISKPLLAAPLSKPGCRNHYPITILVYLILYLTFIFNLIRDTFSSIET